MSEIYLDHAAATPLDPVVFKAMMPYLRQSFGNPSSLHRQGRMAREAIEAARAQVADCFAVRPRNVVFTGSATASDNLAILGIARAHQKYGRHIIISAIEHPAVEEAAMVLEREGFSVSRLPVTREGVVQVVDLQKLLRPDTILVSVMYANNEVGAIQPIVDIAKKIKRWRVAQKSNYPLFHTDATQAVGYAEISMPKLGVDLLSCNASKVYGPKGQGVLVVRDGIVVDPLLYGGGQERGLWPGTENVAGIVGCATAISLAVKLRKREVIRIARLRDQLGAQLQKGCPAMRINGSRTERLPHNLHVSFPGYDGEVFALYLDARGVSVSTGAACATLERLPSHVLVAMGLSEEDIRGSIRFTLGRATRSADIRFVGKVLPQIIAKLS